MTYAYVTLPPNSRHVWGYPQKTVKHKVHPYFFYWKHLMSCFGHIKALTKVGVGWVVGEGGAQ